MGNRLKIFSRIGFIRVELSCFQEELYQNLKNSLLIEKPGESQIKTKIISLPVILREKLSFLKNYPSVEPDTYALGLGNYFYFAKGGKKLTTIGILNYLQKKISIFFAPESFCFEEIRTTYFALIREGMKIFEYYPLHCAGVSKNGKVILILAPGGTGKTALSLQLLQQSFSLLSDDTVFIRDTPSGILAAGFFEKPRIDFGHKKLFPHLELPSEKLVGVNKKWHIDLKKNHLKTDPIEENPYLLFFLTRSPRFFLFPITQKASFLLLQKQLSFQNSCAEFFKNYFHLLLKLNHTTRSFALGGSSISQLGDAVEKSAENFIKDS